MILKYSDDNRHEKNEIIYRAKGFEYRLLPYWAELSKELGDKEITSVDCDSQDNVYVLTRNFDMPIMVFDPQGHYLQSIAKGVFYERPHGIFINKQDELYCTDDKAHVVMKLAKSGELLQMFGTPHHPSDSGCNWNVYNEYREQEGIQPWVPTDGNLSLQMRLDTIVRTALPFNGPTRMIEALSGELFCADGYGNAAIHRFTHDGQLINTFGAPGREPGQFRLPHGLIMDHQQRLWVADRENNRIQIFDMDGNLQICLEHMLRPTEFCTDGTYIYVAESGGGFSILDQDANIVAQFGFKASPLYLHGIGMNSKGDIFGATLSKNKFNNIIMLQRLA